MRTSSDMISVVSFVSIIYLLLRPSDCINASLVTGATLAPAVTNTLQCYQCMVDDNSLCTEEHLKSCGDDQAYDRCLTRIRKTGSEVVIEKKCALAPCTFRDKNVGGHLGMDDCDRTKPEYDCIWCCKQNGCNKDAAVAIQRPSALLLTVIILFVFYFGA